MSHFGDKSEYLKGLAVGSLRGPIQAIDVDRQYREGVNCDPNYLKSKISLEVTHIDHLDSMDHCGQWGKRLSRNKVPSRVMYTRFAREIKWNQYMKSKVTTEVKQESSLATTTLLVALPGPITVMYLPY